MKFQAVIAIGVWFLPLAGAGNNDPPPATGCAAKYCDDSCKALAGCEWKSNKCSEVVRTTANTQCSLRTNDCEDDDKCMKLKGSCVEVNLGVAVNGSACQVVLDIDNDKTEIYKEVTNKGCAAGFICSVENSNGTIGEVIDGTCAPTECLGKKVPGNCNGNGARTADTKDQCEATTQRVTICHRTCSRKNPWVRITIDEDAWSGEGCGHKQHDIRDECKNKFPWTEWGVNRKDYELKFHGTRAHVAEVEKFQNVAAEKAYWRMWEPACPYVRNGHCCQWNSTTNPCCGEPPSTVTPVITHKKYAGPPGSCNAAGVQGQVVKDVTYTDTTGSNFVYCYVTSVPSDAPECLYAVFMKDPAPIGGTGGRDVNVTGDFELLCPGQVKYLEGPIVQIPSGGEGPIDSLVTGVGQKSGKTVTGKDPAAVAATPVPVFPFIEIKKYAGPQGKCTAADIMNTLMLDDTYTLPSADTAWQYCYVVTIPSTTQECLSAVTMIDAAPVGGTGSSIPVTTGTEELCVGATKYIEGKIVTGLSAPEGPVDAVVTGTGVTSKSIVSASDCATVNPPPVVEIKKYAGPKGSCSAGGISETIMKDDTYTLQSATTAWQYCYKITVPPSYECLLAVTMVDPAPGGGAGTSIAVTEGSAELCPGAVKYIEGTPFDGLTATEGPFSATVTGTGVKSGIKVSDDDDATVIPAPIPAIPAVEIKKYAGPKDSCTSGDMSLMQDVLYTLPSASSEWQYCYVITVPPEATECLSGVTMVDYAPNGLTSSYSVTSNSEQLCKGAPKYILGPIVPGLSATEGPFDATVTGKGVTSGEVVYDSDDAKVSPPPNPLIEIKKYAGPDGGCSATAIEQNLTQDVMYTLPSTTAAWQYCYVISIPPTSTECLFALTMVDPAPGAGAGSIALPEGSDRLCPTDVKYIGGPPVTGLVATEGPFSVTVTGTGVDSNIKVSDVDDAAVSPPTPPEVLPVVEIKKYAGPAGSCFAQAVEFALKDEVYDSPGDSWQYCYKISVPASAKECLLTVKMNDPAPIGGGAIDVTGTDEELCPGQEKYIPGKLVPSGVLTSPEGPIEATVTGTGVTSKKEASAKDSATVNPPQAPDVVPVVEIKKYAGPVGACIAVDFTMEDLFYQVPSGEAWQYCYKITVPLDAKECLLAVKMIDPAPIGGGAIDVTGTAEEFCPGQEKYVPGKPVASGVLTSPEGPIEATVTGTGVTSKKEASAKDTVTVNPPPPSEVVPVVEIKKYAGPEGECSAAAVMNGIIMDETYTLLSSEVSWQYCYKITVPVDAKECLLAVKMTDPAPIGGGAIDVTGTAEELCPGQEKYVPGKPVASGVLTSTEGPIEATVIGTGVTSKKEASAKDSATVKPPGGLCPSADPKPPACPADVWLMSDDKDEAETEFDVTPIRIVSQKNDNVTFTISNPFDSDVRVMYYQYATAASGTSKCDSVSDFTKCHEPITVTAHCMKGSPHALAIVDVWFVDPVVVDPADTEVVPKCCQPDALDAGVPTVVYSFKVYCDSKCVQAPKRSLTESAVKSDKAELCSLEQFGCGDDGKSVNVCHYSAKDGYQTYCVPQADSDVVAYFPKDYCGPCVGGYANVESTI